MNNINPYAKNVSFEKFKKKYFRGEEVPNKIARMFYSDFCRAFKGGLGRYINETTEIV